MSFEYKSNATYQDIAARLDEASRIALITHEKPDGDAFGSLLALARVLRPRGKVADIFVMGPLEASLVVIAEDTRYERVESQPPDDSYDLAVVVDTGSWSQLEPLEPWLRRNHDRVVGLDHHVYGDEVASKRVVDTAAASTTQILLDLFDQMNVELSGGIGSVAEALFVGLATDTGWFRHANANAACFASVARFLEAGVDSARLFQIIEESFRPPRLSLMARALSSVQYAREQTVAIMCLGRDDFEQTRGSTDDVTALVNIPMQIESVRVSVLLTQLIPGQTKISFRSKPSRSAEVKASMGGLDDVNQLARHFGGGGHVHAAGARVQLDMDEALIAVLSATVA